MNDTGQQIRTVLFGLDFDKLQRLQISEFGSFAIDRNPHPVTHTENDLATAGLDGEPARRQRDQFTDDQP
jgi:hypothetical protein